MGGDTAMRRRDKLIADRARQLEIVDQAQVLRLGLVDGDRPYVVPMNFGREGDDIWLHSAADGLKLACLRRNPRVCVEIDHFDGLCAGDDACRDWSSRYSSIVAFGTAEIVQDPQLKVHGLEVIMRKYSGRSDWRFDPRQLAATAVVRVRIESITGKRSPA